MRSHFLHVAAVRDAVIAGDLDRARAPAAWLAEHGAPSDIPDRWIPYVTDLRVLSAGLTEAATIDELARTLGVVAGTCASCHEALDVRIEYLPGMPPSGGDLRARMQRHKWAAERLWKGLVFPHETAWRRGAAALVEAPGELGALAEDPAQRGATTALAERLETLAWRAVETADGHQRAQVFGEMLTTCATCHAMARVDIGRSLEPADAD
jgi:cytochrome c553